MHTPAAHSVKFWLGRPCPTCIPTKGAICILPARAQHTWLPGPNMHTCQGWCGAQDSSSSKLSQAGAASWANGRQGNGVYPGVAVAVVGHFQCCLSSRTQWWFWPGTSLANRLQWSLPLQLLCCVNLKRSIVLSTCNPFNPIPATSTPMLQALSAAGLHCVLAQAHNLAR